ncbi:MAG: hypothetical protein ACI854_000545 [Arenicella sp.]|jgi:hypothetical protein
MHNGLITLIVCEIKQSAKEVLSIINIGTFNTVNKVFFSAICVLLVGYAHARDLYNTTEEAKVAASATPKISPANGEKN